MENRNNETGGGDTTPTNQFDFHEIDLNEYINEGRETSAFRIAEPITLTRPTRSIAVVDRGAIPVAGKIVLRRSPSNALVASVFHPEEDGAGGPLVGVVVGAVCVFE